MLYAHANDWISARVIDARQPIASEHQQTKKCGKNRFVLFLVVSLFIKSEKKRTNAQQQKKL